MILDDIEKARICAKVAEELLKELSVRFEFSAIRSSIFMEYLKESRIELQCSLDLINYLIENYTKNEVVD